MVLRGVAVREDCKRGGDLRGRASEARKQGYSVYFKGLKVTCDANITLVSTSSDKSLSLPQNISLNCHSFQLSILHLLDGGGDRIFLYKIFQE